MWWRRRKASEQVAGEPDVALRAELVAAADSLRRQIDVQNGVRFSRGGGNGGDDLAVAMLQTQLDQVEAAIDQLDSSDR